MPPQPTAKVFAMALDVPPPQTPPAIDVALPGEALRVCVFDSITADARLTRRQAAKALTACGVPTSPDTLATKASRGGGPPYQLFGKSAIYTWGSLVAWALAEMGEPARSASEHRARLGTPTPQKPSPEKLAAMVDGSRRYNAGRRKAAATPP
jgi:hypothetical protein